MPAVREATPPPLPQCNAYAAVTPIGHTRWLKRARWDIVLVDPDASWASSVHVTFTGSRAKATAYARTMVDAHIAIKHDLPTAARVYGSSGPITDPPNPPGTTGEPIT